MSQTPAATPVPTPAEIIVGGTTYIRSEDAAKKIVYYIVKGKSINDKEFVFRQNYEASKGKYYYWDMATRKTVWNLPDLSKNMPKATADAKPSEQNRESFIEASPKASFIESKPPSSTVTQTPTTQTAPTQPPSTPTTNAVNSNPTPASTPVTMPVIAPTPTPVITSTPTVAPATVPIVTPVTPIETKKESFIAPATQQPVNKASPPASPVPTPAAPEQTKSSFIGQSPATQPPKKSSFTEPKVETKKSFIGQSSSPTPQPEPVKETQKSFIGSSPTTQNNAPAQQPSTTKRSFTTTTPPSPVPTPEPTPAKNTPMPSPTPQPVSQTSPVPSQQPPNKGSFVTIPQQPSPTPSPQVPSKGSFVSVPSQNTSPQASPVPTPQQPTKRSFTELKNDPKPEEKKTIVKESPQVTQPQPEPVKQPDTAKKPPTLNKKPSTSFLGSLKSFGSKTNLTVNTQNTPKETKSEDDFDDFGYASNDSNSTPQTGTKSNAPLAFKKDENFEDSSTKLSEDSSMRATVMQENPFAGLTKAQSRELEETIQAQLFYEMGKGEIHVLTAIRCLFYTDPKKKEERVVAIARDYCGAFAFFFIKISVSKLKQKAKYGPFISALPMIEQFQITPVETNGDNIKFNLIMDGTQFTLFSSVPFKNKLEQGLNIAFQSYRGKSIEDVFTMRVASNDFARTYCAVTIQGDSLTTFDKIVQKPKSDELFLELRNNAKEPHDRDKLFDKLITFCESPNFKLEVFIRVYQIILKNICTTKRLDLKDRTIKVLQKIKGMKEIGNLPIDEIISQTETMFAVQEKWVSRAAMPSVPFSREFSSESTIGLNQKNFDKKMQKKKAEMAKLMAPEGVYVSVVIVNKEGEILGDTKENLPSIRLDKVLYSDLLSYTENHPDFEWLLNNNINFTESMLSMKDKVSTFPFKYEFRRSVVLGFCQLAESFGNLGTLFDRPVRSLKYNMLQFIAVNEIVDKNSINLNQNYKWYPLYDFEHKVYQRYDGLDYLSLLEKLDSSFYGERWIYSAIKTHQTLKARLPTGFYIGNVRFCFAKDGCYVLVCDDKRCHIPTEQVSAAKLTKENWQWIQSIRNPLQLGKELVDPTTPANSFPLLFVKAMQRLKEKLLLGDKSDTGCADPLGDLYEIDAIHLDDQGLVRMAVFVDSVPYMSLATKLKGKFLWRKVNHVDMFCASLYFPSLYSQFRKQCQESFSNGPYNDNALSADECLRYQKVQGVLKPYLENFKYIANTHWLSNIVTWCIDGRPNLANYITKQQAEQMIQQSAAKKEKLYRMPPIMYEDAKEYRKIFEFEATVKHPSFTALIKKIQSLEEKYTQSKAPAIAARIAEELRKKQEEENYENLKCEVNDSLFPLDAVRKIDDLSAFPTNKELVSGIIYELIDEALTECFDMKDLIDIQDTLNDMIELISVQIEIPEDVELMLFTKELEEFFVQQRKVYKKDYIEFYKSVVEQEETEKKQVIKADTSVPEHLSYEHIVHSMVTKFSGYTNKISTFLHILENAQDMIEIVDNVNSVSEDYDGQLQIYHEIEDIIMDSRIPRQLLKDVVGDEELYQFAESVATDEPMPASPQVFEEPLADHEVTNNILEMTSDKLSTKESLLERSIKTTMDAKAFGIQGFSLLRSLGSEYEQFAESPREKEASPSIHVSIHVHEEYETIKQQREEVLNSIRNETSAMLLEKELTSSNSPNLMRNFTKLKEETSPVIQQAGKMIRSPPLSKSRTKRQLGFVSNLKQLNKMYHIANGN